MITLRQPSEQRLAALVEQARHIDITDPPGLLRRPAEHGRWFVDHHQEAVGDGPDDFQVARDALGDWATFPQPWTRPAVPLAPIRIGETAGYTVRVHGLWWSYCCRIVAVLDDVDDAGRQRFGFEYATVRGHAERGEERFLVTYDPAGGDVTFSLFAVSRPGRWFTWLGLPLARRAQARFRPGAAAAMRDAVNGAACSRGTPA